MTTSSEAAAAVRHHEHAADCERQMAGHERVNVQTFRSYLGFSTCPAERAWAEAMAFAAETKAVAHDTAAAAADTYADVLRELVADGSAQAAS